MRLSCARALGEIGAAESMPQIVAALAQDGDAIELGEILMSFGTRAEPLLRERLCTAATAQERRIAAVTLGEIHAHSAVGDLVDSLEDPDPELRAAAARALGQIGERSASSALVAQLNRPDPGSAGVAAATALGMLDDPSTARALVRALGGEDWNVRNAAAQSLVAFGDRGVAEVAAGLDDYPGREASPILPGCWMSPIDSDR